MFKSRAQMRKLYATEPILAEKWTRENPNQSYKDLPEKVKRKKK